MNNKQKTERAQYSTYDDFTKNYEMSVYVQEGISYCAHDLVLFPGNLVCNYYIRNKICRKHNKK